MRKRATLIAVLAMIATLLPAAIVTAAEPAADVADLCEDLYGDTFGTPNSEPLGPCQWDMSLINAGDGASYAHGTGQGVTVGVIDSGVDVDHPDIAPNLDLDLSCSFIYDDTPTADPDDIGNGDCSNKDAVDDLNGHGTHVASTIAAPINGIGIAGVAPDATIIGLKACTRAGYCFADSVAAALRYAGDHQIDVVNLSLFADPYLYYCKNDATQREILRSLESAARYARQQGVVIVSSAGNQLSDLRHPGLDPVSPDWPPGEEELREVNNNCVVAPAELTGVMTVSATGPVGYPGYDLWIADYSSVGGVEVAAPGGDYFRATGTVQDAILAAVPVTGDLFQLFDTFGIFGLTVTDNGAGYMYLNGTSMSSPHAAGVAALVVEQHPKWGPSAVIAAVQRTAQQTPCPPDWQPLNSGDERTKCYGKNGYTSFFGHGIVDAEAAAKS